MSKNSDMGADRSSLGFAEAVPHAFSFLLSEFGFHEVEVSLTIARYAKRELIADVYHGRRSFELGFEIGHSDELFAMSELLRASGAPSAERYRNYVALTSEALLAGVGQLAVLVERHAERALRDDPAFFDLLRQQRAAWADASAMDVRARQVRPKANAAFRECRYRDAVELYEQILSGLSRAERMKLELARKRSE